MGQVDTTAVAAMALLLQIASDGVSVQIESIAGIKIPKTLIRIRLADDEPAAEPQPVAEPPQ